MRNPLLAKAHIAKLNELTKSNLNELISSTVDETALAILRREGSWRITIQSSQMKIIFDIQVIKYWPQWQTNRSKQAAMYCETSESLQDTWNRYLMVSFVSAHIPSNAVSNLELRQSHKASRNDLVLPSATTWSNIFRTEYARTVDAIKKNCYHRITKFNFGQIDINKRTSHKICCCLRYGLKLGFG